MPGRTLSRQGSPLADPGYQLRILNQSSAPAVSFEAVLRAHGQAPLRAMEVRVLQVNVGKLCNQTCRHCHVDAGPDRREMMSRATAEACIALLQRFDIPVLDITGGAPEMNPNFRYLVEQARHLQRHVIDRCNLTILTAAGYEDLPEFLAAHRVEVVASLPCYLEENTDQQRGAGVFRRSIEALQRLNALGYGQPGSERILTLVYNPLGPTLPPPQAQLESAYRRELQRRYGVTFNRLYTITNMPISRFLADLLASGQYEEYLQKLIDAFNPAAVQGLMCRTTLSVDWQGRLYDCDFNQMLNLGLAPPLPQTIYDLDPRALQGRPIVTGPHCFGCTAGAGSGCQGAIVS
jgi:radical SAM/Cys-rich protein